MPDQKLLALTEIVCGVVLERDDKYLLVQEKWEKVYGKWNLPAGKVDEGETLEQAAVREAKEECGFDVRLVEELLVIHQNVGRPVLHAYKAKIIGGKLAFPKDEMLDARWFSYEEIVSMKKYLRNEEYVLGSIIKARV